ncbi:hypothetical protein CPB86DRAFT_303843 [Serendipita vermifera]|nr:hypothetical protein CPB86DRAFT_303843 [Serendipita vermifera]
MIRDKDPIVSHPNHCQLDPFHSQKRLYSEAFSVLSLTNQTLLRDKEVRAYHCHRRYCTILTPTTRSDPTSNFLLSRTRILSTQITRSQSRWATTTLRREYIARCTILFELFACHSIVWTMIV